MPRLCARKNGRQTPADPAHWQSLPRRNRFGCRQTVSGVLFFRRHLSLVPGNELAVFVVVEAGDALAVGGADEVAVRVVLVSGFLNLVVIAGKGVDQPSQYIAFELGNPQRGLAVEVV